MTLKAELIRKRPKENLVIASLPIPFKTFLLVTISLSFLSMLNALVRWPIEGAQKAFSTLFLINPLFDLYCYEGRFRYLHTSTFFNLSSYPWTYPAPCAWIYRFLYLPGSPTRIKAFFLLCALGLIACLAFWFSRRLAVAGMPRSQASLFVLLSVLFSWPLYFSIERGNIETFLWVGVAVALSFYAQRRWFLSATFIGLVAAFKIYPVLFLALLFSAKRLRELMWGVLVAVFTTLLALRSMDRSVGHAYRFVSAGVAYFLSSMSASFVSVVNGYDHTVWAIAKLVMHKHPALITRTLPIYTGMAALSALILYFTKIWSAPRINQVIAISILTVMLPATSFDYTLQVLYCGFAWLCLKVLRSSELRANDSKVRLFFAAFGVIFAPMTFVQVGGYTFAGQLRAVALLYLLYLSVRFPLRDTPEQPILT